MLANRKIVIIGAGHVGSHCAYALAIQGICDEIVLVDKDRTKAKSHSMDIADSVSFFNSSVIVRCGDYSDCKDADIIVISAGVPRLPGQTRLDVLDGSVECVRDIVSNLNKIEIKGIEKDKEDKQCKKHKEKSKQKHNKCDKKRQDDNREYELKRYTMEEISKFDGKDGTLAYVVINGRVYDVTSIKQWFNGKHYGLTAGKDLTEYFNSCHKSEKNILKKLKIVGKVENG